MDAISEGNTIPPQTAHKLASLALSIAMQRCGPLTIGGQVKHRQTSTAAMVNCINVTAFRHAANLQLRQSDSLVF
jgi:hypothetical protein